MNNADNADNADNNIVKYKMYILEGVGWIGSVLVLIPYVNHFSKTNDFILNTMGASGLLVVCVASKQYQSIVINAAWIIGAICAIFTLLAYAERLNANETKDHLMLELNSMGVKVPTCPKCGKQLPFTFCPFCGSPLSSKPK